MKKVLVSVLMVCMMAVVAYAKSDECEVVGMSSNDGITTVLINCDPEVSFKDGDKIKIRVQKPKETAIEGC